jgi:hypothetical protein
MQVQDLKPGTKQSGIGLAGWNRVQTSFGF